MSEIRSIRVVCTQNGRHPERLLHVWRIRGAVDQLSAADLAPPPGSWLEMDPCRTCGVAPRIGPDTIAGKLVEAIAKLVNGDRRVTMDIVELNV